MSFLVPKCYCLRTKLPNVHKILKALLNCRFDLYNKYVKIKHSHLKQTRQVIRNAEKTYFFFWIVYNVYMTAKKTFLQTCALSEDSDQPAHTYPLIRILLDDMAHELFHLGLHCLHCFDYCMEVLYSMRIVPVSII